LGQKSRVFYGGGNQWERERPRFVEHDLRMKRKESELPRLFSANVEIGNVNGNAKGKEHRQAERDTGGEFGIEAG
jgi:hypothetical protein